MNMLLIFEGLWILVVVFLLPAGIIALYLYLWCIRILPEFTQLAYSGRGLLRKLTRVHSVSLILRLLPSYFLLVSFFLGLVFVLYPSGVGFTKKDALFLLLLLPLMQFDHDFYLLPDPLTYSLLWSGVLMSLLEIGIMPLASSIWGIFFGYFLMAMFRVGGAIYYQQEVLGLGDLKLVAALGAWIGHTKILMLLFLGASIALLLHCLQILFFRLLRREMNADSFEKTTENKMIPFGPALGLAGLTIYFMMALS